MPKPTDKPDKPGKPPKPPETEPPTEPTEPPPTDAAPEHPIYIPPSTPPSGGTMLDCKGYVTTGSMTAGSNILCVDGNPGFAPGDYVIVATGGEPGLGVRGTIGVGGTNPSLRYRDAAAREADLANQPDQRWCALLSDGTTWVKHDNRWKPHTETHPSYYYTAMMVPKALCARVVQVNGNDLELDKAAVVNTVGAMVHYDNAPYLKYLIATGSTFQPNNNILLLPEGEIACSSILNMGVHNGWRMLGAGAGVTRFISPHGTPSMGFYVSQCHDSEFADFSIEGNALTEGYGLGWDVNAGLDALSIWMDPMTWPSGLVLQQSDRAIMRDILVRNVFQKAFATQYCNDTWAKRVKCILDDGQPQYIQWQFLPADSWRCGTEDCELDSAYVTGGFEVFGGGDCVHRRLRSRNGTMSMNGTNNPLFIEADIVIEANSQFWGNDNSFSHYNPIWNINSNIGAGNGGTIQNCRTRMLGPINPDTKHMLPMVAINNGIDGVRIIGDYKNNPNHGLFEHADYQSPGQEHGGATRVSGGTNRLIEGCRFVGKMGAEWIGQIHCEGNSSEPNPCGLTVRNCIVDSITGTTGGLVSEGNMTNAEWESSGRRPRR